MKRNNRHIKGGLFGLCTGEACVPQEKKQNLIITTGDASDFDGFMALPLYYKAAMDNNADVVFIMNYPAYLLDKHNKIGEYHMGDNDTIYGQKNDEKEVGKGYTYGLYEFLMNRKTDELKKEFLEDEKKTNFLTNFQNVKETYMNCIDNMVWIIVNSIWKWCEQINYPTNTTNTKPKPKIIYVFDHKAINTINPFSVKSIKDELEVYDFKKTSFFTIEDQSPTIEHFTNIKDFYTSAVPLYSHIYIDMNGSMAWFKEQGNEKSFISKIKRCYVMGGILDNSVVDTMSAVPGVLNRLSSATMNQLYAPECTKRFFNALGDKLLFITNNEINAWVNKEGNKWSKKYNEDEQKNTELKDTHYNIFKKAMQDRLLIPSDTYDQKLGHSIVKDFKSYYYNRPADRKPFDVISALYLCNDLYNNITKFVNTKLFYNSVYGCTILSESTGDIPSYNFLYNKGKIPEKIENITNPFFKKITINIIKECELYASSMKFDTKISNVQIATSAEYDVALFNSFFSGEFNSSSLPKNLLYPVVYTKIDGLDEDWNAFEAKTKAQKGGRSNKYIILYNKYCK